MRKKKIRSPHDQMTLLDEEGTSYVIEDLSYNSGFGGSHPPLDVIHHSEQWMLLGGWSAGKPPRWVNMANVLGFRIVAL